jgi:hypothetical protein
VEAVVWSTCQIFVTRIPTNWHKRALLGIIAMLVGLSFQANYLVGPIAQSVEQRTFNPWVDGSSPSGPTHLFSLGGLGIGTYPSMKVFGVIHSLGKVMDRTRFWVNN